MTGFVDPEGWGVATGYHDHSGEWREAPSETVQAILAAMGAPSPDGDRGAGHPPDAAVITVRTDRPLPGLGAGTLITEDGRELHVGGPLPEDLPCGYHRWRPDGGGGHNRAAAEEIGLVVSPGQVPMPSRHQWGFAAQLYAVRSGNSWGIGDLGDLAALNRWAGGLGAGFTLVNPLHAPTPARPVQPSPYYPGSRCFLNPIYIAVEQVPGAGAIGSGLGAAAAAGRALNAERLIDRDLVWALKSTVLEKVFDRTAAVGGPASFDAYVQARGTPLELFAVFQALAERFGPAWRGWPAELRHPRAEGVSRFATSRDGARQVRFHSWLQWLTETQAEAAARELGVVADLAVGVDPSGPDSWIWQDSFAEGIRVGAPPDEFNTQGQDWGLPPFDPWRLAAGGYEPWIQALRSGMAHGAGLRVDHVMGLFRLYWIPEDADARHGTYVRYPSDAMLDILALEAQRAGAYVVGEDLGTVEDRVRRDLSERRVLSYRVWWFEADRPEQWPEAAMGAVTTHDLPTVAGVLSGSDLQAQRDIGSAPNEDSSEALLRKLHERTGAEQGAAPDEVIDEVYRDLGTAPCCLLAATLDDVLAVEERPNMPGTTDAWPNWSLALPAPLEDLVKSPLAARVAGHLRRR